MSMCFLTGKKRTTWTHRDSLSMSSEVCSPQALSCFRSIFKLYLCRGLRYSELVLIEWSTSCFTAYIQYSDEPQHRGGGVNQKNLCLKFSAWSPNSQKKLVHYMLFRSGLIWRLQNNFSETQAKYWKTLARQRERTEELLWKHLQTKVITVVCDGTTQANSKKKRSSLPPLTNHSHCTLLVTKPIHGQGYHRTTMSASS